MPRRTAYRLGTYGNPSSINTIITDYKKFHGVVESECERILGRAAEMTLDFILPLVPVETGALKESGRSGTIRTSKGVAAFVSFGGPDAPVTPTKNAPAGIVNYAAVVNYDREKAHPNGGEDLFMEKGTAASKETVDAFIMSELRKLKP